MNSRNRIAHWLALAIFAGFSSQFPTAHAQGTAFTYQGRLSDGGIPALGIYDIRFAIYDAVTDGNAVSGILTNADTSVANGLFSVTLDFGADVFTGPGRWLELAVRTNGAEAFTVLSPRQSLLSAPYAITAQSASNLLGALPATQLSGTLPVAQLPDGVVTNGQTNLSLSGTWTGSVAGNAAGLTDLNGANLLAGSVPATALADNFLPSTSPIATNMTLFGSRSDVSVTLDNGSLPWTGGPNMVLRFSPWASGFQGILFQESEVHNAGLYFWPNHAGGTPELLIQSSGTVASACTDWQHSIAGSWCREFYQYSTYPRNMFRDDPDIYQGAVGITFASLVYTDAVHCVWAGSHAYAGGPETGLDIRATVGMIPAASEPGWHFRPAIDKSGDGELVFWSQLDNKRRFGPWSGTNPVVAIRAGERKGLSVYGNLVANDKPGITSDYIIRAGDTLQIQNGLIVGIVRYVPGWDTETLDYMMRVGLTTNDAAAQALDVFVKAAKVHGWWANCEGIYPMTGADYGQNLRTNGWNLTLFNTSTNASGLAFNGSNSYGSPGFVEPLTPGLSGLSETNVHLFAYVESAATDISGNQVVWAADNTETWGCSCDLLIHDNGNYIITMGLNAGYWSNGPFIPTAGDPRGPVIFARMGDQAWGLNSTTIAYNASASFGGSGACGRSLYLGQLENRGGPLSGVLAGASFGSGMSTNLCATMLADWNTLETALGRKVP